MWRKLLVAVAMWALLVACATTAGAAEGGAAPRPGYVLVDEAGRYGYEPALNLGDRVLGVRSKALVMLAYAGMRGGAHQLLVIGDADLSSRAPRELQAFDWRPGDAFIRQSLYWEGKLTDAKTMRVIPDSLIAIAMRDADRGLLKRYVHAPKGGPKGGVWVYCDGKTGCGAEPVR